MILKSFGCSFIFGSELHDDGYNGPYATPSQHTWPALLAKDMSYEYQCHARPGSGNLQILERLLNQLETGPIDLCVIGWTWIDRFDYNNPLNDQWQTITPTDTNKNAEFYYRNLHSQYRDKFTNLTAIKTGIDELERRRIKFIMTYMDDLLFETKWHSTAATINLQNHIKPHLHNFDGDNFLEWSCKKGFPIGNRGKHPLESAHRAAFELVKSYNLV
jgi:hypothetical protein